jgi:shikimate kinase
MQKANIPCYPKHISLIGFMGIGKSSMATILAKSLGMQCVDIDSLVEKKYNASISSIIMSMGENYFREIEREILCDALNSHVPSVIACGGGAMIMPESQKILRQNSIVVWLYAPLEQCISNIGNAQTRPLLAHSSNPMLMAQILFQKRIPMYARTAWILINMHGKSIEQGAEIIRQEVIRVI